MKRTKTVEVIKSVCIICGLLTVLPIRAQVSSFDNDKPVKTYTNQYTQTFTTWDKTTFYNQWEAVDPTIFTSTDIAAGYLQFVWVEKRIICSKTNYYAPYILQTDIDYGTGSNRGGVIIRVSSSSLDDVQEPAAGDPGFNREGIAFYPSEDGSSMIVQFSGAIASPTPVTRITVPKPAGVTSLKSRGALRIEDFGASIYVYYNDAPFIRINLGGLTNGIYTSGTVYNSAMEIEGTFSEMEVVVAGKVAIAQRDATLKLFGVNIQYNELKKQTINFNSIGTKQISDSPFTLSANSSSGLPVEFKIVSGPATLNGNTITLNGLAGMVVVAASQSGNEIYFPADKVEQAFFVEDPTISTKTEQLKAYGDSWVATDAIGRTLPNYRECGDYRSKKYVGMFYWLWHANGRIKGPLKTAAQVMHENPNSPAFEFADYYWGEPENGFYHPSDPWSTRRNLQLLADAGVDFVFFDFTNGDQGDLSLESFMAVAMDMYHKGIPVPKISFFLNVNLNAALTSIMDKIYSHPEYDPLLFKWQGKPLLMADSATCAAEFPLAKYKGFRDHFTWRKTWAFDTGQWNFNYTYPQAYFSYEGGPEQISVSKALGAPVNDWTINGASVHNSQHPQYDQFWETDVSKYGYAFDEQWSRAHEIDPSIVCVTGWNELMAGAWTSSASNNVSFMGKTWDDPSWRCVNHATCPMKDTNGNHIAHGWYFVDEFNSEFDRDIEPMKGGYTDNYYYQLVSHIRKYKGMSHPEPISAAKTIAIDGNFNEWLDVTPVYKDPEGEVTHRNFQNVINSDTLVNNTGRNDIIESRSTYDDNNVYFYVKTAKAPTPSTDANWMLLFIDADRNKGTGWEGYDFVVNLGVKSDTLTTIKRWNGTAWGNEITVPYKVNGKELELSVPRSAILMDKKTPEFYFKWADNLQQLNDITSFFTDGDVAPDRRFNFNYSTSEVKVVPETAYKTLDIPGTVEFEDFDNGSAGVAYADATIGNAGGAYRTDESVDIEPMAKGGYDVTAIDSGEWLAYTVNVDKYAIYTPTIHYATGYDANGATMYVDDVDRSGVIDLPSTGGSQTWGSKDVDIKLTAGEHVLKFYIQKASGDFKLDKIDFTMGGSTNTGTFNFYPNPVTDKITIQCRQNKVTNIEILDLQGRVVYTNGNAFTGLKTIDISLAKGCYFLKLAGNGHFATQKLIIE